MKKKPGDTPSATLRYLRPRWGALCWLFEIQPRKTLVVKTGSDTSTAKRSELGMSVKIINGCPVSQ